MEYLFLIIILIFSIVIHEVSHGAMAYYLGDPTAKYAGRLTLNPIKHLDPVGSVILPAFLILINAGFIFGWAKPVPINPYNFKDQRYGSAKTAIAGPAANLALALIFGLILRFLPVASFSPELFSMFSFIVYINILLAVFNLLPIPPLDGSHILFTFLPAGMEKIKMYLNQFGILLFFLVIFFLFPVIRSIINWIFNLIVGMPLF